LYSLSSAKRAGIPSPSGNNVTALDISGKPEELGSLESQQVLSVIACHGIGVKANLVSRSMKERS